MIHADHAHENLHLTRAANHQHLADVHLHAARVHNDAAEFFDRWRQPERADHERLMAAGEHQSAAAERQRASRALAAAGQSPSAVNGGNPAARR